MIRRASARLFRHHVAFFVACGLALLCGAAPAPAPGSASAIKRFDLPADAAEKSLKRLSVQSGVEVLFATEMTAGIRTASVQGEFSVIEAANRALAQTGLVAVQDARTGTLTINRASASPNERDSGGTSRAAPTDEDSAKKKKSHSPTRIPIQTVP